MSDRQSALFRTNSEPDLHTPAPSPPSIPLPSPSPRSSLRQMLEDADAYPISTSLTPLHTPPLSPVHSPPQQSPHAVFQNPQSAVSFSEYVASELAHDQSLQQRFGVSFAPAKPDPQEQKQGEDPFGSESNEKEGGPPMRLEGVEIVRSETEPVLKLSPSVFSIQPDSEHGLKPGNVHEPVEARYASNDKGGASPHVEPVFMNGSKSQYGKLDCFELDEKGGVVERQLTRADILHEARATLNGSQPSPTAVGRWLSCSGSNPSPEFREFTHMLEPHGAPSRRATQRALRDYLRNSLQARDIRQVDPAFVAKPALWVRHSALVVSLEGLRAIILHNKMFLFDPDKERTRRLLFIAKQSVGAKPDEENPQPFEFKALEGILISLNMGLESEFGSLKSQIEECLHLLPTKLTTVLLEELRRKKQELKHFHSRANSVKTILDNLLDEDEDMSNMYLTEKYTSQNYARRPVDHSEVETLLEAYLQVIEAHVNQSKLLNDAIDDTEDLVMIHLDTLRNRLLSIELAMSVVSMTFGFGGVVSGIFGMNIQIPLFQATASKVWFFGVVTSILTVVVMVSLFMLVMLRRRGL